MIRVLGGATFILMMVQMNVLLATDWWHGERDPYGPYPRIPDKDLVKVTFTIVMIRNSRISRLR